MTPQTLAESINAAHAANARGDYALAEQYCCRILKAYPDVVEAWYNRGVAKRGLGQSAEAIACQKKVIALSSNSADAQNAAGLEFIELDAYPEAEQCLNRALALVPNHVYALSNKAYLLRRQRRYAEAEPLLRQAIHRQPGFAPLHANLGAVLYKLTRFAAAEKALRIAVELDSSMPGAWNNLANALSGQHQLAAAEDACRHALALNPELAEAWSNLGDILLKAYRHAEAAEAYAKLIERAPEFDFAKGRLLYCAMQGCDWRRYEELRTAIEKGLRKQRKVASPFGYMAISESPAESLTCARIYADELFPAQPAIAPPPRKTHYAQAVRDKIRIGYLSGEFFTQATAILMAGLYEQHDKSRFTIIAFDNGKNDQSELRKRLENAFDEMVDIATLSDAEAAEAIRSRDIDLLVNLNGYFGQGRQSVFARRPSPIQVNYLGFPGTLGVDYIDYLIADTTVIPEAERQYYAEKIAWLPGCYQANDNRRALPSCAISREQAGLPTNAFVFCCFNNSYKITPARFALWMRILAQVDGSVLWLIADNATATANLQREAAACGIAAERLVFAQRTTPEEHLARHQLADLFIDSLPYNAHTTASDALWTGLPILTQTGKTFPGRVAASLLEAVGLPELITRSDGEYEARAIELATNPERLHALRQHLEQNRMRLPLFDTARFTRHLESAFTTMHTRRLAGESPDHFHVQP